MQHPPSPTGPDHPWHSLKHTQVLAEWEADAQGLSTQQADARLEHYGPNRLKAAHKRGPLQRFLSQFHDVLIYVLLAAAAVTAILAVLDKPGHWIDTGVILGVVVINALIGFIQEGKAEKALDAIRGMLSLEAEVIRNGRRQTIDAEDLVPGDIVLLKSGDKVPADLRLIDVRELRIDEAALTGESVPVEKQVEPVDADASLGDRASMAYSSTLVTSGRGKGVVIATAHATQIGRISDLVTQTREITTPLVRQVTQFGKYLAAVILALAALTFAIGWLGRNLDPIEMFLAGVALAVAAIPEGLPAIMTIVLAIGVQRMAGRNAIIRRLPAVDTLGALTVICSDKTGTLTRNEMMVTRVATANRTFIVTGEGYEPNGRFRLNEHDESPSQHDDLMAIVRAGLLCNEARVVHEDGRWQSEGDPMEGALITLARKADLDDQAENQRHPTRDAIPFESQNRYMATLHEFDGQATILVKGAPERVLEMCANQGLDEAELDSATWLRRAEEMAEQGQRVLAVARKPAAAEQRQLHGDDVSTGLTMLGLFGIIDPPRREAITAVQRCREAGIRVKMITGDHATTARAIGRQMGIGDGEKAITGRELDQMDDEQLVPVAHEVDVFARVSPEHKLRLVQAIQARHEVVAMTGDGVNDAPALKRADVGIAMGIKGTEVTKEAAEMVLADDNFASIAHAVEEGRTVYDNLRKAILFILPTNGGEALTILMAIILGRTLPLTPVQVLWVNMITAVTLALALAFEPPERDVMKRPPRDPRASLLDLYFLWRITFVSTILCAGTFGMFVWMRAQGADEQVARTVAVNTLVMFEAFYLLNCRFIMQPMLSPAALIGNRVVLLAIGLVVLFQMAFTYLPLMQMLFGTAAIGLDEWALLTLVAASVFVLVEAEKALIRTWTRMGGNRPAGA